MRRRERRRLRNIHQLNEGPAERLGDGPPSRPTNLVCAHEGFFLHGHAGGYSRGYFRCSRHDTGAHYVVTYRKDRGDPARVVEKGRA
jgi:hypothetical protein